MGGRSSSVTGVAPVRILVVDDEEDLAEVLRDLLRIDGHQVDVVPDGRAALEHLRRETYDVVMSDFRMPDVSGPDLYRTLRAEGHPVIERFIFMTGDVLGPDTHEFLEFAKVPTLSKPFGRVDVRRVLAQVLSRPTG